MTILRHLLVGFAILLLAAPAAAQDRGYTVSEAARERGLQTLSAKLGQGRPIVSLLFSPDQIAAVAQPDAGDGLAQWTVARFDLWVATFHRVSGPSSYPDAGLVEDTRSAYFQIDDIDLSGFDEVIDASVAFARLASDPVVQSVEIAKTVAILPTPAYGDIRWTVRLAAMGESATVYLDNEGRVIGGDLSDTERAQNLNFLLDDDWPAADAQAALRGVLGNARVHDVSIDEDSIFVTADHPTDPGLQRDYSWNLSGVRQGLMDTPNLVTLGMGSIASFAFSEVDLTALPKVKAAAREAYGAPDAVIKGIEASKPTDRAAGDLKVLWEVEFRESNGEEGSVWLDASAGVVEVKLPDSRLSPAGPWLAPETVVDTLRRIGETFGPEAKLSQIIIDDEQASIDIEDPQAPGEVAHFLIDAREVTRFGSGSFFASLADSNVFTPSDLGDLTVEQLNDMVERTKARLKTEGGDIFRFTFSRHALIMNPEDNRLMVEIRYGQQMGRGAAGWMTFLLDGTQTDELLP